MRHKLKLYSGEDTQGNQNPKKPVRRNSGKPLYNPTAAGLQRWNSVRAHLSCTGRMRAQWYLAF